MFIESYDEILKFPSRVSFYCQGCGKLTEKEFRKSTKHQLYCAECNIKDGKSKRTSEQKLESNRKRHESIDKKYGSFDKYLEYIQTKAKDTMTRKFGVDNAFKSKELMVKAKKTKLEKYGDENYSNSEKARQTMNERYGAPTTLQSEELVVKVIDTKRARYGEHLENIVSKIKRTKLERYGDENFNNPERNKETCMERYGVEHPMLYEPIKCRALKKQSEIFEGIYGKHYWLTDDFKEKSSRTCVERYGVENPSQSVELRRRAYARYDYNGMRFDSKWELAVWIYAVDHDMIIEREPVRLEYEYDGERHYYFPDFRLNGELIEIKGDQFFNENGTMRNPYDPSKDGMFEAKRQCGLKNGVRFIRKNDIKLYLDYINITYGKGYLAGFRKRA